MSTPPTEDEEAAVPCLVDDDAGKKEATKLALDEIDAASTQSLGRVARMSRLTDDSFDMMSRRSGIRPTLVGVLVGLLLAFLLAMGSSVVRPPPNGALESGDTLRDASDEELRAQAVAVQQELQARSGMRDSQGEHEDDPFWRQFKKCSTSGTFGKGGGKGGGLGKGGPQGPPGADSKTGPAGKPQDGRR